MRTSFLRSSLLFGAFLTAPSFVPAAVPVHLWSKQIGDSYLQAITHIAIDPSSHIAVAGGFAGVVNFGGVPLTATNLLLNDVFVARLDPTGGHVWSKRFGDELRQAARAVAAGPSGEVAITGDFVGSVNFGGATFSVPFGGQTDLFVAVFDAGGNHVWSRAFGGEFLDLGAAIAFDPSGNVIIGGHNSGSVDFGGGPLPVGDVLQDAFLAKFDSAGTHLWSLGFGQVGDEAVAAISVDGSGNIIAAGVFEALIDLGGGILIGAGGGDAWLAKFDSAGSHVWSKRFGTTDGQRIVATSMDAAGNIAVSGDFFNAIDLGGGVLSSGGGVDGFVARFDADGNHVWSRSFGDASLQGASSVAMGPSGVVITGYSVGTADFGGGPLVSAGGEDVFVAKYSHAGAHVWSARFGDAQNDRALSVGVDAADQVVITGSFAEAINFGGGTFLANGGGDFFLAKFDQEDVVPVLITDFRARVSDDRVELRWRASSDENIASWVVNRWTGSGTRPDRVASGTWDALGSATDPKVEAGRTYRYELTVRTDAGDDYRSPTATVTIPASTNALGQNAPNPFNPSTRIEYSLAARARAVIAIHDSSGRLVRRLDGGVLPAGRHAAAWDGRDTLGRPVASGVYFYRLEGIPAAGAKRMVLLK